MKTAADLMFVVVVAAAAAAEGVADETFVVVARRC